MTFHTKLQRMQNHKDSYKDKFNTEYFEMNVCIL